MTEQLLVTYDEIYLQWQLGAGDGSHPTNPIRAAIATDLLVSRLENDVRVTDPAPVETEEADRAALDATHEQSYVARTLAGDSGKWLGTRPEVGAAAFAMFRGSIRGVEAILSGEAKVVFNPQGAKHHARFDRGSGFCVFNDMAYAAKAFQAAGLRPLYIDWDIHAGDGVMHMLAGSGVPTISIHHGSTYPSDSRMQLMTGERGELHEPEVHNYNFNVAQGDGDDVFTQYIDAAAAIIDDHKPDVILLAAGADGHTGANTLVPLANYTKAGFHYAASMIAAKANQHSQGRVLIGGAGGYQPLKETPETWALVVETIFTGIRKDA